MERRTFITSLGAAVLAAPLSAQAVAGKVYRLGVLGASRTAVSQRWLDAFIQELRRRGWVIGENIVVELRFVEPGSPKLTGVAGDVVGLGVDAILATSSEAAIAARKATPTIPIVGANLGDPVSSGLVVSLARPGGNVTGTSIVATELAAKQIQLLKEAVPSLSRIGVLWNPNNPSHPSRVIEAEAAGQALRVRIDRVKVRTQDDLQQAIPAVMKRDVKALLVLADPQFGILAGQISRFAAVNSLPTMYGQAEHVELHGGLMSYGANFTDLYRRTAVMMDRVLRGSPPANLPVEQATKFELAINLKTAKALGLTIPQSLLLRADQVIE